MQWTSFQVPYYLYIYSLHLLCIVHLKLWLGWLVIICLVDCRCMWKNTKITESLEKLSQNFLSVSYTGLCTLWQAFNLIILQRFFLLFSLKETLLLITFLYIASITKSNVTLLENRVIAEDATKRGWKENALKITSMELLSNLARISYTCSYFFILKLMYCVKNVHAEEVVQTYQ